MTNPISIFDIKTKKEFDKLFKGKEEKWIEETRRIRRMLKTGY